VADKVEILQTGTVSPVSYERRRTGRSLRYVMISLIVMTLAPIIFAKAWKIYHDMQHQIETANVNTSFLARLISDNYEQLFQKAHTLLSLVGNMSAIRGSGQQCHDFLKETAKDVDWQNGLWVAAPDGKVLCSSLFANPDISIAEREYFKEVMTTRKFTISQFVRTQIRRHPALIAVLPILNEQGQVDRLVMATLDVVTLSDIINVADTRGASLLLVDGNGALLNWVPNKDGKFSHNKDRWGENISSMKLVDTMLAAEEGRIKAPGPDDIERFWSFTRIEGSKASVAMGLPELTFMKQAYEELIYSIVFFVIVILFAIALAWGVLEYFLMRNIRALVIAAEKIGDGKTGAVVSLPLASGELDRVAHALNTTALRIREREEALRESQYELAKKSDLLGATFDTMDQGLIMVDENRRIQIMNRRAVIMLDWPEYFLTSKPLLDDIITYQASIMEYNIENAELMHHIRQGGFDGQPDCYERQRPDGTTIEVRSIPVASGGVVRTYTDISARKDAENKIAFIAHHDPLTGLPNRALFHKRLNEAIARTKRYGEPFALFCLDLDRFKIVNDTLGHPAGDALLKCIARRLKESLREEDVVARLGGDEFAILQTFGSDVFNTSALAERLIDVITQPVQIESDTVEVGTSIGIALCPQDATDADLLFRKADLALYESKNGGRGQFRFFEKEMDAQLQAKRALEIDLREALAQDELLAHYQPLFDIEKGVIIGFEALARWNHPKRGMVSPVEFIPLAEETNLIVPLGRWILRRACKDAAAWPLPMKIAVNVSSLQFRKQSLIEDVSAALTESSLPPERLELEITESVLMQDKESSTKLLHQLRNMGVRIAMDDFGTGYSSLSYLRSFPFDKIKIDASFIRGISNPDCAAIVRAVVELGRQLNVIITAEGVETIPQLAAIKRIGCHQAQGYLISPPIPAIEAAELMTFKMDILAA
jgi:diguanylate cyclase (GGDEF)-like protein